MGVAPAFWRRCVRKGSTMSDTTTNFYMPEGVAKEAASEDSRYARFTAEPFESGYAQTVGNSLRRVLLSSIEGVAITAIKLEGAQHEFMSVPGIAEDVTDIVIALKQVLIKATGAIPERISIHKKGPCTVTAGDFVTENAVEIINPDLPIATVAAGAEFNLEAEIAKGRGFHPAEWNKKQEQEIGIIPIDSIFSPVSRVNFAIEPKRVGNRTDYEKLVLDVWTDGRITPEDALCAGAALLRSHFDLFADYNGQPIEPVHRAEGPVKKTDNEKLRRILAMSVNEIELSVRSANCLNNANITTVGELACKSENDMLKYRNFGRKSLNEIKDKLAALGVGFGAEIDEELLAPYRKKEEEAKAAEAAKAAAEAAKKAEGEKAEGEAAEAPAEE